MRDLPLDNAKHEHFCQLYANGESATQAYVLTGYSAQGAGPSSARLLKKAPVCERIAYLRAMKERDHAASRQAVIDKAGLNKEWVIAQLMENVAMAKQAEPVLDADGKETGEYKQNLPAANKALELLGVELGMFIKKAEVGKPGEFSDLTDAELEREIKERERQLGAAGGSVH